MKCTPVNTYGLCEDLQRGDKFRARYCAEDRLEKGTEVEIVDFVEGDPPPQCKNQKAKLLKFKDHVRPQWHPMWVINCSECPFYDSTRGSWMHPGSYYQTKGDRSNWER